MSVWGRVAVAGVFEHPTRFAPDKTAYQIHAESARGALAAAGLSATSTGSSPAASVRRRPLAGAAF
jgi:hypothetical protein